MLIFAIKYMLRMKRDKLYTVDRWNKNIFDGLTFGQSQQMNTGLPLTDLKGYGVSVAPQQQVQPQLAGIGGLHNVPYIKPVYNAPTTGGSSFGDIANGVATGLAPMATGLISDGYSTGGVGETISGVGNAVGNFLPGPWGTAAKVGSAVIGGLVNRAFGMKTDQEKLTAANTGTSTLNNFVSNATSFDELKGPDSVADVENAYKGGWFNKGKARRKNAALRDAREQAVLWADRSLDNNITNITQNQLGDALANYSAYGGYIGGDNDMGVIDYGFMQDYLTQKKREAEARNKMAGLSQMPAFMPQNSYAIGGDLQSHGSDWSDGLVTIGAGGSHETNPYEGVQLGVDNEGTPNLVEEGEVIFNDYVFSNRIPCDLNTKKVFHIGKKREITYAELAKRLEKEISERPNDPISKSAFKKQMGMLEEQQERQKQEMEAARAREAFEALSPDEQTAVMQEVSARENLAAQEQAMAEQQAMQQPTPEEAAMMQQQQMMQADGSEAVLGQEPQMNAEGGRINKFEEGGKKNSGKWKDATENHWDVFTRPGLLKYLEEAEKRINAAPDGASRAKARYDILQEFNNLQHSYFDHVAPKGNSGTFDYDEGVLAHQKAFDKMYGNTGFYSVDDQGNVTNLIANAINMPRGHATDDKPSNWFDGYAGPRTSIRNFGSTEYGDSNYYQELVDKFKRLGFDYAPNGNLTYGNNYQLYSLSMPSMSDPESQAPIPGATAELAAKARTPRVFHAMDGDDYDGYIEGELGPEVGTEVRRETLPNGDTVIYHTRSGIMSDPSVTDAGNSGKGTGTSNGSGIKPKHRAEWLRYAGLFGPAVGLGMQALGIGRPDTSGIDAAASVASRPATLASYRPLGNYLTYRPMDIWFEQNRMDANSRATDRALMNTSGGNRGTAMAGLLANGYNSQMASGDLYRKALEYNDAQRERVAAFNRGTDQFNSEQFGQTSRFNADALNRQRQYNAQLQMQAAAQKAAADAGWYNSLYGNVSGLFKGLGNLGTENFRMNRIADMWADGLAGTVSEQTNTSRPYVESKKSKGGRMKRKGLTF